MSNEYEKMKAWKEETLNSQESDVVKKLRAENKKLRDTIQKLFDDWNNRGEDTTDIDQYLAWMELEEMLR